MFTFLIFCSSWLQQWLLKTLFPFCSSVNLLTFLCEGLLFTPLRTCTPTLDLKPPNMLTMRSGCPQHQNKDSKSEIFPAQTPASRLRTLLSRIFSALRLLALLPCRSSSLLNQLVEPISPWVPCSDAADGSEGAGLSGFLFFLLLLCRGTMEAVVAVGDDLRCVDLEPRLRVGCTQTLINGKLGASWRIYESCGEHQVCRRAR